MNEGLMKIHPSLILHSSFINPSFIRYRFVHVSENAKMKRENETLQR